MATELPGAGRGRTALLLAPAAVLLAAAAAALLLSRPHLAAVLAVLHVATLGAFHLRRIRLRTERLEHALREATAIREARAADLTRLQAILDSMVDGVLFIDAEDRVAMVNAAGRAAPEPLRRLRTRAARLPPEGLAGDARARDGLPPERRRHRAGALHHQGARGALRDHLRAGEGAGRRVPRDGDGHPRHRRAPDPRAPPARRRAALRPRA